MQLGWIDFSKSERNKILSVLDLLQEGGTLDELGIAPVRDGFSNIFFPGTSTIQRRAKYFLLVPYILKDLESSSEIHPGKLRKILDAEERSCGEYFYARNPKESGLIGSQSISNRRWVKRAPSEIYWNGLRKFGIFIGGDYTLTEYLRISCGLRMEKTGSKTLGNRNDKEEHAGDDKDAGSMGALRFWNIPTYAKTWRDDLHMALTAEEAAFLKNRILSSQPDSMLGYILRENMVEILDCETFQDLAGLIHRFPQQIQQDYDMALQFSHFLFVIRTAYNRMVSDQKNTEAEILYEQLRSEFPIIAHLDLEAIISRLHLEGNRSLCKFLFTAQTCMTKDDFQGLCKCIKDREILLKGSGRAKTAHAGQYDPDSWFGGYHLSYRFDNAKTIIRDIFEGEVTDYVESQS